MAIILLIKIDMRFLSIPIVIEALASSRVCYLLVRRSLDTETNIPIAFYLHIFLVLSTLIMLALIFCSNKIGKSQQPLILYTIPGIFRVIYAIYKLITDSTSPLHITSLFSPPDEISQFLQFWYSMIQFLGGDKVILSIAYILLGILIKRLADEKNANNVLV